MKSDPHRDLTGSDSPQVRTRREEHKPRSSVHERVCVEDQGNESKGPEDPEGAADVAY
jgi:hypothetical protein